MVSPVTSPASARFRKTERETRSIPAPSASGRYQTGEPPTISVSSSASSERSLATSASIEHPDGGSDPLVDGHEEEAAVHPLKPGRERVPVRLPTPEEGGHAPHEPGLVARGQLAADAENPEPG